MAFYQPSQALTWKYLPATGQLTIVSTITVSLDAGEKITCSLDNSASRKLITISIDPAGTSVLPPVEIPVNIIATGLNKDQVRDRIRISPIEYFVNASVYKANKLEGESITITTSNSHIQV